MPVPIEYRRASDYFEAFLLDARDSAELGSTHQAYTMTQGVLLTFRRRLSLADAVRFAGVLPPVVRAIFVAEWNPDEPQLPFSDRALMTREVRALRADHNFAPDEAMRHVARALRKHVDQQRFDAVLGQLPAGAVEYWQP